MIIIISEHTNIFLYLIVNNSKNIVSNNLNIGLFSKLFLIVFILFHFLNHFFYKILLILAFKVSYKK